MNEQIALPDNGQKIRYRKGTQRWQQGTVTCIERTVVYRVTYKKARPYD